MFGRPEIVEVVTYVATLTYVRDWRKEAEAVSIEEPTNVMPLVDTARRDEVRFESEGLILAGHLYRARGVPENERAPVLVMAGPMTSVKEETLPHYAERLQDAGYTVLAFDNRNFGESAGEPRQHLDTYEQVEDLKNAVSYMLSREDTDSERIGLCCVCLGAGYGLEVATMDRRVKAVALVAGGYNITDTYLEFLGPDGFRDYIENLGAARQHQYETGEIQYMPAVVGPPDFAPSAMPVEEAYAYYTRAQEREAPNWENRLTVASMEHIVGWKIIGHAHLVEQPLLIVHGTTDVLLPPRYAQEVYERAPEPKEISWIETTNHVELYDGMPHVSQALERIVPWLDENLKSRASEESAI